jgi:putative glutamine amidotransferase
MPGPRIAVTLTNPDVRADPATQSLKNARYLEAVERAGGIPVPLDERSAPAERAAALAGMDGLLITGGADIDPARYGEARRGAHATEPGRDSLDAEAFAVAMARGIAVLGICRGLQAINVFSGGRLVQHVDGHESGPWPATAQSATRHHLRLDRRSRLAAMLGGIPELEVNSFHHQAVTREGLAHGLRVAGTVQDGNGTQLVEALESADPERWLVAVQCHPERTESTPGALSALWLAFVDAAARGRGPADTTSAPGEGG